MVYMYYPLLRRNIYYGMHITASMNKELGRVKKLVFYWLPYLGRNIQVSYNSLIHCTAN